MANTLGWLQWRKITESLLAPAVVAEAEKSPELEVPDRVLV